MNKSLFIEYIKTFFAPVLTALVNTVNGKKEGTVTYLHKQMLVDDYSTDLKWGSSSIDQSITTADVVALDSPLPLKKRDTVQKATGDIPKLGVKYQMSEKEITDINILRQRGGHDQVIAEKLMSDPIRAVQAVWEKTEAIFLEALSSGLALVDDDKNVGVGIRVDYGIPNKNRYGVTLPWTEANAKPMDDIKRVMSEARARGEMPTIIMMDIDTFEAFAGNQQVREEFAFTQNFIGTQIPTIDQTQATTLLTRKFALALRVVDRTVFFERNGVKTAYKPWAANMVTFLPTERIGRRVHSTLAEELSPNQAVTYQKVDGCILVKRWHNNEPFAELTSSQALLLPVLDNTTSIFLLNTQEAVTDAQTEGNSTFAYKGQNYTKASVATALKLAYPATKLTSSSTDAKLLEAINKLSDEQILIFEANITLAT